MNPKGSLLADASFSVVDANIIKVHVNDMEAGFSDTESRLQRCETALDAFLTCRQNAGQTKSRQSRGVTWTGSVIFNQKSRQNTPTMFTAVPQKHYFDKCFVCIYRKKEAGPKQEVTSVCLDTIQTTENRWNERRRERASTHINPLMCDSSSNHQGALTRIICPRSSKKPRAGCAHCCNPLSSFS